MTIPGDPVRTLPHLLREPALTSFKVVPAHEDQAAAKLGDSKERATLVTRRRLLSRPLTILISLIVSVGVTLLTGFQYRWEALFRIHDQPQRETLEKYRLRLLDYCSKATDSPTELLRSTTAWTAAILPPNRLKLSVVGTGRDNTSAAAHALATGFTRYVNKLAEIARTTPDEVEAALSRSVDELRSALTQAQTELEATMRTIPESNPSELQRQLLAQWEVLRPQLIEVRIGWTGASGAVARLRSEPDTPQVVINANHRRDALQADTSLQQDLKELAVNLTELKLQLLSTWQQTSPVLERLQSNVEELKAACVQASPVTSGDAIHQQVVALEQALSAYQALLATFAGSWTLRFTELRNAAVDPKSESLLATFQRSRQLVDEFLFRAGKELAHLRAPLEALRTNPTDEPRLHQAVSNLLRAFQALQTAHHRFEFLAGSLETSGNFRLDAALRASRGLSRRSQDRIREIETHLLAEATREARQLRRVELAAAEQTAESMRTAADRAMAELLALQDSLNLAAAESSAHQASLLGARAAAGKVAAHRADLHQLETRLRERAEARIIAANAFGVTIVSSYLDPYPVNLGTQTGIGFFAGFSLFLSLTQLRRRLPG